MKKNLAIAVALLFIIIAVPTVSAQANDQTPAKQEQKEKKLSKADIRRQQKAEAEARQIVVIDSILTDRRFVFVAERVMTQYREVMLNYRASLAVEKDKVISQLPFYGESSNVAYSSSSSPLDFTAEDVSYQSAPLSNKKDGKAFVLIKARNEGKSYTIGIEIFVNGAAAMSVTLSGASPQTFYGWIEPIPQKN